MNRNSTTLFLQSPGAVTPIPWVNNAPDFSQFTEPSLSVLEQAWQEFLDSGEGLEVILDPEPIEPAPAEDYDGFNAYMLTDPSFRARRDIVRAIDPELNSALYDAYGLVAKNGVNAFALVWNYWSQLSGIPVEERETLAQVAESLHLPTDFIQLIRG